MADAWLEAFLRSAPRACPVCGEMLLDATGACRRCQCRVTLALVVPEGYLAAWGSLLGVLTMMAAFGLFLLLPLVMHIPPPRNLLKAELLWGCSIVGVLALLAVFFAVKLRLRFCRLPRVVQWILVVPALLLLAAQAIAFLWAL